MKTEDFSNIQRSVTKSVTVTFLFRLEGLKLNDTDWINNFKEKRTQYGVSQNRLAVMLAFFDWRVFGIAFVLFLLSVIVTKWISLGSILGAVSFPITTWVFYRDPVLTAMALGMAAVVVFMHRSNIGRIIRGKENKFSFKSKKTMSD